MAKSGEYSGCFQNWSFGEKSKVMCVKALRYDNKIHLPSQRFGLFGLFQCMCSHKYSKT